MTTFTNLVPRERFAFAPTVVGGSDIVAVVGDNSDASYVTVGQNEQFGIIFDGFDLGDDAVVAVYAGPLARNNGAGNTDNVYATLWIWTESGYMRPLRTIKNDDLLDPSAFTAEPFLPWSGTVSQRDLYFLALSVTPEDDDIGRVRNEDHGRDDRAAGADARPDRHRHRQQRRDHSMVERVRLDARRTDRVPVVGVPRVRLRRRLRREPAGAGSRLPRSRQRSGATTLKGSSRRRCRTTHGACTCP